MSGSSVGPVSEYATTVVRIFPDYAGTVIWFSSARPYEQTRLDDELVAELRAWDASDQAGVNPDFAWSSPAAETAFYRAGARLARRVADQIGDEFQVQYDAPDGSYRRVRASGPPRNEDAAAAFCAWAAEATAEWEDLRHAVSRGERFEWRS